jgi:hypothetical protein
VSRSRGPVTATPRRLPLRLPGDEKRLDVAMHEYAAVRNEIDTCLTNQVAILSFGTATVGLLVAAAATLWDDEPLLSSLLLLFVVPAAGWLALVVHAGELVRLMRAGLFLHRLEDWVNDAWWCSPEEGRVLLWEQWDIRRGSADVDRRNSWAITAVFAVMVVLFVPAGFWRLQQPPDGEEPVEDWLSWAFLGLSLAIGVASALWLRTLRRHAYAYRDAYDDEAGAGGVARDRRWRRGRSRPARGAPPTGR